MSVSPLPAKINLYVDERVRPRRNGNRKLSYEHCEEIRTEGEKSQKEQNAEDSCVGGAWLIMGGWRPSRPQTGICLCRSERRRPHPSRFFLSHHTCYQQPTHNRPSLIIIYNTIPYNIQVFINAFMTPARNS